jgi:protein TonB
MMHPRYPVAMLAGIATAVGLLGLMQTLITGQEIGINREVMPLIEFVRLKREPETRSRERTLPQPPPEPQPLPRPLHAVQHTIEKPVPAVPGFSMRLDLVPDLAGGVYPGFLGSAEPDRDFIPVSRIPPQYPYQATRRRIEGWVRLSFRVTETGTVEDVVLLDSEPEGIFDRAALRAVARWTFQPRLVDGQPVAVRAEQVVEFKLSD